MAVTITNYGRFNESLLEGRVNVLSDEFWIMLVTSAYTFNPHAHKFKSSITGELIGSGYTAGGKKLSTSPLVYASGNKQTTLPAANVTWPASTFSGLTGAILYVKRSGVASNAMPLMSYMSFGESISRNNQAFYINWPTTGILKMAA